MTYKNTLLAGLPTGTPELLYFHSRVPVQIRVPVYWNTEVAFVFMAVCLCSSEIHIRACIREEIPSNGGGSPRRYRAFFKKRLEHAHTAMKTKTFGVLVCKLDWNTDWNTGGRLEHGGENTANI